MPTIPKLSGEAYIKHWDTRISKGPHEAGDPENGNKVWEFITPFVSGFEPRSILEYGCAYGRMMRHLHEQWPDATLYGVDLCKTALDTLKSGWTGRPPKLFNRNTPPLSVKVDMIFTCTVLQHITDKEILGRVADGFRMILNPGGKLVLFENINWAKGGGGAHMLEYGPMQYMELWPELEWNDCGTFYHGVEAHQLMIGMKG